ARGVDVSVWQGTIDWNKVAKSGVKFAICRVSHGTKIKDTQFKRNWQEIKKKGLVRGVYQYFIPSQSATQQANMLCNAIGKLGPGDLPPVLDVEERAGASPAQIKKAIETWVKIVKKKTGLAPIIYTSPGFWNPLGIKVSGVDLWGRSLGRQGADPALGLGRLVALADVLDRHGAGHQRKSGHRPVPRDPVRPQEVRREMKSP
ncbi:MAG: glycoside hydrolase family 25 protein, partial [Planctomycetota bacterium]